MVRVATGRDRFEISFIIEDNIGADRVDELAMTLGASLVRFV